MTGRQLPALAGEFAWRFVLTVAAGGSAAVILVTTVLPALVFVGVTMGPAPLVLAFLLLCAVTALTGALRATAPAERPSEFTGEQLPPDPW